MKKRTIWENIEAKIQGKKSENLSGKQLSECMGAKWEGKKEKIQEACDVIKELSSIYETDEHAKTFMNAMDEASTKIWEVMSEENFATDKNLITIIASSEKKEGDLVDEKKEKPEEEEGEKENKEEKVEEIDEEKECKDFCYASKLQWKKDPKTGKWVTSDGKYELTQKEIKETKEEEEVEEDTGLQRFLNSRSQSVKEEKKEEGEKEDKEEKEEVDEDTPLQRFQQSRSEVAKGTKEEEIEETRETGDSEDYLSKLKAIAQKRKALEEKKEKPEEKEEEKEEKEDVEEGAIDRSRMLAAKDKGAQLEEKKHSEEDETEKEEKDEKKEQIAEMTAYEKKLKRVEEAIVRRASQMVV